MTERSEKQSKKSKGATKSISRSTRAGTSFPVVRLHRMLKVLRDTGKCSIESAVFMAAVLEYLTAQLLQLSGEVSLNYGKKRIIPRHMLQAIRSDEEFNKLLHNTTLNEGGSYHEPDTMDRGPQPSQAV